MQAGLLKDLISIFKPELSSNEYGELIQEYVKCKDTKSQVKFNNGNRGISNDEVVSNYTKTFIVRHYIEINDNYIIEWNKNRYRILSIEDNKQYQYKQIIAELINE
jgi:head-tail adaptor